MSKQSDYANKVYQDALALGIPEPQARLAAAQSSVETGYGDAAPGNAYFGIKAGKSWTGPTINLNTHEEDASGNLMPQKAKFRAYDTPQDSLSDWWNTLQEKWPDAAQATTFDDAVAGLKTGVNGAYATKKSYPSIVSRVNASYLPPIPPAGIPGAPNTALDALSQFGPDNSAPDASAYFNPLPAPAPLTRASMAPPPVTTFGGRLPPAAMNGVGRINPGTSLPIQADLTVPGGINSLMGAPDLRTLGMASPQKPTYDPIDSGPGAFASLQPQTKTILNPAYTQWQASQAPALKSGQAYTATGNVVTQAQQNAFGGLGALPAAPKPVVKPVTPAPPKYITVQTASAPAPTQPSGGGLGSLFSGIGSNVMSGLSGLTSAADQFKTGATQFMDNSKDAVIQAAMMSPQARGAFLTPMLAGAFTSTPMQTGQADRYGDTFAERQLAAQNRDRLTQGLPPLPTQPSGLGSPVLAYSQPVQKPQTSAGNAITRATSGGGLAALPASAVGLGYINAPNAAAAQAIHKALLAQQTG